jgi:hypothetical protein
MAKRLSLPSLIAIVALSMSVFAGANPGSARITLEDLAASDGLATPVLSPSGREFAFTADGQIKLLPADGGWPVALTTTGSAKPERRHASSTTWTRAHSGLIRRTTSSTVAATR